MGSSVLPVSVVIPAYRRPRMVERAIRSVLEQRPQPAELLVVDDCSGDDTGSRAAALGAQVITHPANQGRSEARNTGLRNASHEWVALLDCDDQWLSGHLATLWAARDGHVLIGTALLCVGKESEQRRIHGWTGRRARVLLDPADVLVPDNKFAPSSALLRRQVALAVGGFRAAMPRAEDLDLWVRLVEQGSALAIPDVTVLYHLHSGQISGDVTRMHQAHRQVLDNYAGRPWRTPAVVGRFEGPVAWDSARAALASGSAWPSEVFGLARELAAPSRLKGVIQLLIGRWRGRRRAARFALGGGPTIAIMPGADPTRVIVPAEIVDLRDRSLWRALTRLARRPTAYALSARSSHRLIVRVLGIKPLRSSTQP